MFAQALYTATEDIGLLDRGEMRLFLSLGLTESNWSVRTKESYARDLELYVLFLEDVGCKSIGKSDASTIISFIESRRKAGDSPRTLARRQAALRSFHRFLLLEGVIKVDVRVHLPTPKRARTLPHYLTLEEVDALLDQCRGEEALHYRDLAIVELLYATGIRVSEMTGLDTADFRRDTQIETLKVLGKGRKERFVPVHGHASLALDQYLTKGRPRLLGLDSPSSLFLGRGGRALSRIAVYKRLRKLGQQAGIRQSVTPHLLRHTFATHMVHEGADLRSVQEMLGHANLETTTIYTSVDAERLKAVHARAHPRA